MKTLTSWFRMAILGLLIVAAAHAGSTTFNFSKDTGTQSSGAIVDGGQYFGTISAASPATYAEVLWNNGFGLAWFVITVETDDVAPGIYYIGTIPGGDDIYVEIT